MTDKRLIKKWLLKAEEDFGFAANYLPDEKEFFAPLCFHFHQAIEKYLKTYIVAYNLKFKKIHSLENLLRICVQHDNSFQQFTEELKFLDSFYSELRYPVIWDFSVTKNDALRCFQIAKRIREFVKIRLL